MYHYFSAKSQICILEQFYSEIVNQTKITYRLLSIFILNLCSYVILLNSIIHLLIYIHISTTHIHHTHNTQLQFRYCLFFTCKPNTSTINILNKGFLCTLHNGTYYLITNLIILKQTLWHLPILNILPVNLLNYLDCYG